MTKKNVELEINKFVEILTDSSRIAAGGSEFESWAENLLNAYLTHRDILCYGGIVVPQIGKASGEMLQFHLESLGADYNINVNDLIADLFQKSDKEASITSVSKIVTGNGVLLTLICTPILSNDKPIGLFWVIVDNKVVDKSIALLNYVSVLASLAITSNKLTNAINLLAQPVWKGVHNPGGLAEYAANLCLKALGCRAVIVWRKDNKNMLITVSSVGANCDDFNFDMLVGDGIAGQCAATGDFITINNLQHHIDELAHPEVVQENGFYSAMFAPLDLGGEIGGVFAVYGSRPNAFSVNDENITKAIVHLLSTSYGHSKRDSELAEIEKKLNIEAPAIETGLLAIERIHDANNQLAFAQNSLNFILERCMRDTGSYMYKHASEASEHIKQAKKTINALARRAKLDDIKPSKTDIKTLINDVMTSLDNEMSEIKVKRHINCPERLMLNIDTEQMTRVLTNIIGNSLYFLNTVTRDSKIEINVTPKLTNIDIKIRDNGPGISPNEINKVFNMFYTSKGGKGMGFGLAIAKRIIEKHRGSIRVKSEWGAYTEFTITLPL